MASVTMVRASVDFVLRLKAHFNFVHNLISIVFHKSLRIQSFRDYTVTHGVTSPKIT